MAMHCAPLWLPFSLLLDETNCSSGPHGRVSPPLLKLIFVFSIDRGRFYREQGIPRFAFGYAVGTNAVTEAGVRMLGNVRLQITPAAIFRADLLAPGANRKKPSQSFNLGECLLQLGNRELKLPLGLLLFRHIRRLPHYVGWVAVLPYYQVPI